MCLENFSHWKIYRFVYELPLNDTTSSFRRSTPSLAAFSRTNSIATFVKFFNMTDLPYSESKCINNHVKEFYNSCKAAFSADAAILSRIATDA